MPGRLANPEPGEFEWDDAKANRNVLRHGVDFRIAAKAFSDPNRMTFDASRAIDGEPGERVLGRIGEYVYSVVYTRRSRALRIISARRASRSERRVYHGDRPLPT